LGIDPATSTSTTTRTGNFIAAEQVALAETGKGKDGEDDGAGRDRPGHPPLPYA
jgi:hypothetical protein